MVNISKIRICSKNRFPPVMVKTHSTSDFLNREQLLRLKMRAMRAGVWFRSLPRIDRVLIDLTIKIAPHIRSARLAKSILTIADKLEGFLKTSFKRTVREIGLPIAHKQSFFAQAWGNKNASEWASDMSFARYWAIMKINGHPCCP